MRVVLASGSPRRIELLRQMGLLFDVIVPQVNEAAMTATAGPGPLDLGQVAELATRLAVAKAKQVSFQLEEEPALVVAADTIVVQEGRMLGKPSTRAHARRMLRALSGQVHQVLTGLAVLQYPGPHMQVTTAITSVKFRPLTEPLIDAYVRTHEPMDKAGAYGIQGKGAVFVEAIEGCYFNVVGLPVYHLSRLLERLEYPIWTFWHPAE